MPLLIFALQTVRKLLEMVEIQKSRADDIRMTSFVLDGIKPLKTKYVHPDIWGYDVETIEGDLYTLQAWNPHESHYVKASLYPTEVDRLKFLLSLCKKNTLTILAAHNLEFDLGSTFPQICSGPTRRKIRGPDGKRGSMTIFYNKPSYLKVRFDKKHMVMMDTAPWFRTRLKYTAKAPPLEEIIEDLKEDGIETTKKNIEDEIKKYMGVHNIAKLKQPSYLGKRAPEAHEKEYFKKYAMMDAQMAYKLMESVCTFHKFYDVNPTFTVRPSTLSAKIFKKKFLNRSIPYPPKPVSDMALKSYWGGRTEAFGAGHFEDVDVYDYNSFYPYAMSNIVMPIEFDKWKRVKSFEGEFGFYNISGSLPDMKVSPLPYFDGRLTFPVGEYRNITVTGYEAARIKKYSTDFRVNDGYVYTGKKSYQLKDYISHFYKQKAESKSPVMKNFFKLLLNSLYGKFVQVTQEKFMNSPLIDHYEDIMIANNISQSGGLFNPVVGSWITGLCRATLFDAMKSMEKYIIYTDTDSLIVKRGAFIKNEGVKLGELKHEHSGSVIIIREKLYVLLDKEGEFKKAAVHGFWGKKKELLNMIKEQRTDYKVDRMIKLFEAKRRNMKAFKMMEGDEAQKRTLEMNSSYKRKPTGMTNFMTPGIILDPLNIQEIKIRMPQINPIKKMTPTEWYVNNTEKTVLTMKEKMEMIEPSKIFEMEEED